MRFAVSLSWLCAAIAGCGGGGGGNEDSGADLTDVLDIAQEETASDPSGERTSVSMCE